MSTVEHSKLFGVTLSPNARVWLYSSLMNLSTCLFGGDTGSIGSITMMPQFIEHFGEMSEFLRGFVVAVILIPSAVTGLLAGSLADRISRKRTVSLGGGLFALGMIICIFSPNLTCLIIGRCIAGAGEGLFLSASTVYLCEIAPKHLRGRVMTVGQMFCTGAIAMGFFVCYGTIQIQSSLAWRLPMMISTFFSLIVAVFSNFLPYSPRWLVTKGRKEEAELVLNLITSKSDEAERKELLSVPPRTDKSGWLDIFQKGVRGRTCLGILLNVSPMPPTTSMARALIRYQRLAHCPQIHQQLSGIDFVLYYAPLLFSQAGLDAKTSSLVASGVTGLMIFMASGMGNLYVDKVGRRTLFLYGGVGIAICHTCIGALYASGAAYTTAGKWTIVGLIELFAIIFMGTFALVVRLYSTEIQPSRTRSAASSFGTGSNQLVNTIVALTSPAFLAKSSSGPYFLYGGVTAFGTFIAFLYMRETIGKSLETIDTTFESSSLAVTWPSFPLLASGRSRSHSKTTNFRRSSRRKSSTAHLDENGRPSFPGRYGMERLGSSMSGSGLKSEDLRGSAIEE